MDDIQKERPKTFLLLNENVFANDKWDVGRTDIVTHKIDTQHADPIRQEPRRLPFGQRSELTTQIDKMLKQDIIEPSESPWSSPIVLIRKKDGTMRLCIDYCRSE